MAGTSPSALSGREYTILKVLWDQGPLTVRKVRELLAGAGAREEIPYTTVLSLLQLMERKGYVVHEADGKTYRYRAKVSGPDDTPGDPRFSRPFLRWLCRITAAQRWRMTPGSILERGRRCGRSWNSGARHPNRRVLAMTDRTRWWVEALGHWGLAWALVVLFVGGWILLCRPRRAVVRYVGWLLATFAGLALLPAIAGVVPASRGAMPATASSPVRPVLIEPVGRRGSVPGSRTWPAAWRPAPSNRRLRGASQQT